MVALVNRGDINDLRAGLEENIATQRIENTITFVRSVRSKGKPAMLCENNQRELARPIRDAARF
jgi:hypothetical protein